MPKGCFLVSGQFPGFEIGQRPRTIRYRIADRSHLFRKRTPSSAANPVRSAGIQAAKALRKHAVSSSSSSEPAANLHSADTNHHRTFKMPRHHFHHKSNSAKARSRSQSNNRRSKATSTSNRATSEASSSTGETSDHSQSSSAGQPKAHPKRPAKENPVKKGFLDEYYDQIFGDYLDRNRLRHDHKYQIGTEIAKRFISGVDDALKGRAAQNKNDKNYAYGYRTFQLMIAKRYQGKRMSRLSVLLIIVRRILQRFIAQNRDYYVQNLN